MSGQTSVMRVTLQAIYGLLDSTRGYTLRQGYVLQATIYEVLGCPKAKPPRHDKANLLRGKETLKAKEHRTESTKGWTGQRRRRLVLKCSKKLARNHAKSKTRILGRG